MPSNSGRRSCSPGFTRRSFPGITWSGTGTLPLATLLGAVDVFLEWHRNRPGLVVYNLWVRGDEAVLLAYGIVAIRLAIIAIILSRGCA